MIWKALYFFLPAYIANAAPSFFRRINFLNKPVDCGHKFRGKRIFGDNKTFKGLLVAIVFGTLMFALQKLLFSKGIFLKISLINYSSYSIILGFLLSTGTIFGDLFESFFKRQRGILSGKPWVPFDQTDYVIGALLFSSILFIPNIWTIIFLLLSSLIIHPVSHYLGFLLKINKDEF
ncbi:MAG: CDP-archaeol synthase [Nanoarchaeota archaeon]|nr:CDP-archaeol synthase [Nanoarchaeota archaeon]